MKYTDLNIEDRQDILRRVQSETDKDLYLSVIDHRRTFIGLRGFDYQTLLPQTLSILPPAIVRDAWKKDYQSMQESMIYEESPSFEQMIEILTALNQRINAISY